MMTRPTLLIFLCTAVPARLNAQGPWQAHKQAAHVPPNRARAQAGHAPPPCCASENPEKDRLGRCASKGARLYNSTQLEAGGQGNCPIDWCPVACGGCRICYNLPLFHAYKLMVWKRSRQGLKNSAAVVEMLRQAGAASGPHALPPCCASKNPEKGRMGRCASKGAQFYNSTQLEAGGQGDCPIDWCPVACGRCRICRKHPLFQAYKLMVWKRSRQGLKNAAAVVETGRRTNATRAAYIHESGITMEAPSDLFDGAVHMVTSGCTAPSGRECWRAWRPTDPPWPT